MRDATTTLFLGYGGAAAQTSQALVRRTRFGRRPGSGRVTIKRAFTLEGPLTTTTTTTTTTTAAAVDEDPRGGATTSRVEDVSSSFNATKKPSHVFQTKRRTRVLDRKTGTGRSTTLRLFPLEAQELGPKVLSPTGAGATVVAAAATASMQIVPYDDPMELDNNDDDEAYCSSPEAGFPHDYACFDDHPEDHDPMVEDGGALAQAAADQPRVANRRPKGEPHQRLRNMYKNRKSLAPHGLRTNEDTGLRRSTRRKVKPLQYWRNEKVEYGRQHKSLPTIASIALRSPDEFWPAPDKRKGKTKSRMEALKKEHAEEKQREALPVAPILIPDDASDTESDQE